MMDNLKSYRVTLHYVARQAGMNEDDAILSACLELALKLQEGRRKDMRLSAYFDAAIAEPEQS